MNEENVAKTREESGVITTPDAIADGQQPVPPPFNPLLDTVSIGHYQIVELLGSGGMSAVYKARHTALGSYFALKLIAKDRLFDAAAVRRFQQEARAATSLNHQHIAAVREFGQDKEGRPFIAMDFINGQPLSELLSERKKLTLRDTATIISQVLDALDHAHNKGVVHRDIKPSNILIIEYERSWKIDVSLVDFGIAKIIGPREETDLTQTGEVFGSPNYMSPEQCLGRTVDERSDIYSVGCVLYECLTGKPPFSAQTALETLMLHTSAPVPELEDHQEISEIIKRAMRKNPQERYQSAREMNDDLSRVRPGQIPAGARMKIALSRFLPRRGDRAPRVVLSEEHNPILDRLTLTILSLCLMGCLLILVDRYSSARFKEGKPVAAFSQIDYQGQKLFDWGDYAGAKKKFLEAQELAQTIAQTGDKAPLKTVLQDLADISFALGEDRQLQSYLRQIKELEPETKVIVPARAVDEMLSRLDTLKAMPADARDAELKRVILIAFDQADAMIDAGNQEEAKHFLKKAIARCESVSGPEQHEVAQLYFALARACAQSFEREQVNEYAGKAMQMCQKAHDLTLMSYGLWEELLPNYTMENLRLVESCAEEQLIACKARPDSYDVVTVYLNLGKCAALRLDPKQALVFFQQAERAMSRSERHKNGIKSYELRMLVASADSLSGQVSDSRAQLSAALDEMERAGYRERGFPIVLGALSGIESKTSGHKQAEIYSTREVAAAGRFYSGKGLHVTNAYIRLADAAERAGDYRLREKSLKSAIAIGKKEFRTSLFLPSLMCDLSRVYQKQHDHLEEEYILKQALSLIENNNLGDAEVRSRLDFIDGRVTAILTETGRRSEVAQFHKRISDLIGRNAVLRAKKSTNGET